MNTQVLSCHQCSKPCVVKKETKKLVGSGYHAHWAHGQIYYAICGSGSVKVMKGGEIIHVDCIKVYIEELNEKDCIKTITQ